MSDYTIQQIREHIEDMKHASAIAADQIHPEMDEATMALTQAEIEGCQAQIEYLDSFIEDGSQ